MIRSIESPASTAGSEESETQEALLKRLVSRQSRLVWASGGLSPVLDAGGGRHSVFAEALLNGLRRVEKPIRVSDLFRRVAPKVAPPKSFRSSASRVEPPGGPRFAART